MTGHLTDILLFASDRLRAVVLTVTALALLRLGLAAAGIV
jgi:hypothetical protein